MKHIFLLLLILTTTFGLAYAQQSSFGIKAGMNISRISGPDAIDSADPLLGVHAGVTMRFFLSNSLVIQPELLFTQKGYRYTSNSDGVETKTINSIDYVELPVLAKFNIAFSDFQIQPYGGLFAAYNVYSKEKQTISSEGTSTTNLVDISDQINKLGYGFLVGADVAFLEKYTLGARYDFGLSEIFKNGTPEAGSDVKNGVFMLSLGYLFNN